MKKVLSVSSSYCVKEKKRCVGWVDKYFKDCLCNLRDELSFACGLMSLVAWGVAEIPQIITNFRSKSSHGVSLLFLLTWIAGDAFNLVGCLLEPATLPTQFYTALLYTASTVVLVLQSLYYDYLYNCWKGNPDEEDTAGSMEESMKPAKESDDGIGGIPIPAGGGMRAAPKKDYYYTSARSLAGSSTPPIRSYPSWTMRSRSSGPSSAVGLLDHHHDDSSSSEDDETIQHPSTNKSITQPRPIPPSAGYGAFLATSVNMPQRTKASMAAYIGFCGRKLLQHEHETTDNKYGQLLGWMMAAIYMGGRLPQIWLNIKRGSVEGLNPLMFIFALIANVAYVGSIVIRSSEWAKIKANMPWLLDAVVCVGLDLFIILQYIYYRRYKPKSNRVDGTEEEEKEDYDYSEFTKALVC